MQNLGGKQSVLWGIGKQSIEVTNYNKLDKNTHDTHKHPMFANSLANRGGQRKT